MKSVVHLRSESMTKQTNQKTARIKSLLTKLYQKARPRLVLIIQIGLVVVSVTLITIVLEEAGWLQGFERAAMDAWLRANFNFSTVAPSKQIVIVNITDQDYADIFLRKSPLNKTGLEQIINALAPAKPLLIGVDIDTSEEDFRDIKYPEDIPIIWAEAPLIDESHHSEIQTLPALGGAKSSSTLTGVALMRSDSDGVVRSYVRRAGQHDSFAWVLAMNYCVQIEQTMKNQQIEPDAKISERCAVIRAMPHDAITDEELALDLLGGESRFQQISARELLDAQRWNRVETLRKLTGRAVLVGGTFYAGRDEYTTPLGRMSGLELVAHAVDSELHGPFRRPSKTTMLVLNLVGGIVILLLFIQFGVRKGCLLSLLTMFVIAPLWSWIAFGSIWRAAYFAVILIALLIHQLYEQAHYVQHQFLHHLKAEKPPDAKR